MRNTYMIGFIYGIKINVFIVATPVVKLEEYVEYRFSSNKCFRN
jgi:hypothetical protein